MSLLNALRAGVAVADKVTKSLQTEVAFERHVSSDGAGAASYAPSVGLRALVDWKQKQIRTASGVLSVSRASVTFLDITKLLEVTQGNGVSDNDRIQLPDGTTGPILDMGGFIDAGTGRPLATEVFLG